MITAVSDRLSFYEGLLEIRKWANRQRDRDRMAGESAQGLQPGPSAADRRMQQVDAYRYAAPIPAPVDVAAIGTVALTRAAAGYQSGSRLG